MKVNRSYNTVLPHVTLGTLGVGGTLKPFQALTVSPSLGLRDKALSGALMVVAVPKQKLFSLGK